MANTGTTIPGIPPQYFTDSGAPAASYRIFSYLSGTTTKTPTYTDVGISVANTNPIVLDAAGRATIFLAQGVAYKFVFAAPGSDDPPSSPVWTRDNISAIPPAGSSADTDVSGTAGENLSAGDAVYLADGTGGTTTGRWYKTDADAVASSTGAQALGFATAAINTGSSGTIRVNGRITGLAGLTAGSLYYISATAGALTTTAPTFARTILQADSTTAGVILARDPNASTTLQGTMTFGTQSVAGDKTWTGASTFTGTSLFSGRVKVTPWAPLANDFTDHATVGTGATDVWTVSVPANTLADGEILHVEAYGDCTGDANAKTFAFTLGSTTITPASGATGNFTSYKMHLTIGRVSASAQRVYANIEQGQVGFTSTYAAWAENLGNVLTLKITLTHATAGTTTQRLVHSWIQPAF